MLFLVLFKMDYRKNTLSKYLVVNYWYVCDFSDNRNSKKMLQFSKIKCSVFGLYQQRLRSMNNTQFGFWQESVNCQKWPASLSSATIWWSTIESMQSTFSENFLFWLFWSEKSRLKLWDSNETLFEKINPTSKRNLFAAFVRKFYASTNQS